MSLENEYYNEKQLLENAREKLAKMEEMDVKNMTQEQLDARERVIKSAKEDIEESEELLNEIKEELIEFVNNGGEVSEEILNEIKEEESSSSNSFEDTENRTYVRENLTLIINEGAEFSIEYEDYTSNDWDSDYYMAFTPKFNGERVMLDGEVYFQDPYTYEHFKVNTDILYENGAYIIEIPKGYWEDDDFPCEEIIAEYKTAFKRAYAQTISKELGVYAQYGENAEQLFEECNINDIALVTDGNLHQFLIDEGIIDE